MNLSVVKESSLAFNGSEHFLAYGVVGKSGNDVVILGQRDDCAEVGDAVGVVASAIQRVDHPLVRRVAVDGFGLLSKDAEIRKLAGEQLQDSLLSGQINVGHDIRAALEMDLMLRVEFVSKDIPSGAGGF